MNSTIYYTIGILFISFIAITTAEEDEGDCSHPPPRTDLRKCCPTPKLITPEIEENCEQYKEELTSEEPDSTENKPPRKHMNGPCYAQCILNETNIMTADFKIDEGQLQEYLDEIFAEEPLMIPVVEQAAYTCLAKGEAMRAKWLAYREKHPAPTRASVTEDADETRHHCCPRSAMFLICVMGESFVNCPKSIWHDNKRCNDWRSYIKRCHPKRGRHWQKHHQGIGWHHGSTKDDTSTTSETE